MSRRGTNLSANDTISSDALPDSLSDRLSWKITPKVGSPDSASGSDNPKTGLITREKPLTLLAVRGNRASDH
jgi:hypothetical protein